MEICSIFDESFREYGEVVPGDFSDLLEVLKTLPRPEGKTMYVPSCPELENCPSFLTLQNGYAGGLPIQLGFCSGQNSKLNCLEFHRDSEVNLAAEDFILLLARRGQVKDGKLDTSLVKAFRVPKGVAVEVYATTLHYAPCGIDGAPFCVMVLLPKGTNESIDVDKSNPFLWAKNKWLYAHPESSEARNGAYVGLVGKNLEV